MYPHIYTIMVPWWVVKRANISDLYLSTAGAQGHDLEVGRSLHVKASNVVDSHNF